MTQVITKASLDQFQNALGLNRRADWHAAQDGRRVYLIDTNVSPTQEIVSQVAEEFWAWRDKYRISTADRFGHRQALEEWESTHCKIRLCHYSDDTTKARAVGGYIVLQDELLAFHNSVRGAGLWMLDHAINDGATKLSCFDVPHLIKLYQSRGFTEVNRQWNETRGTPDVVWMVKK